MTKNVTLLYPLSSKYGLFFNLVVYLFIAPLVPLNGSFFVPVSASYGVNFGPSPKDHAILITFHILAYFMDTKRISVCLKILVGLYLIIKNWYCMV